MDYIKNYITVDAEHCETLVEFKQILSHMRDLNIPTNFFVFKITPKLWKKTLEEKFTEFYYGLEFLTLSGVKVIFEKYCSKCGKKTEE